MSSTVTNGQRVKLHKVVNKLVDKWSLECVEKAKKGDFEAMLQVADVQFSKKGWGKIAHNPYQGRRWVEFAASRGDPYALYTLKNLVIADAVRQDKISQLQRYAINHAEHPRQWKHPHEYFQFYTRGFNPRRLSGIDGPTKEKGPFKKGKLDMIEDPEKMKEAKRLVRNQNVTPSMKLRNGEPYARYRFPAVYSKNDVFRAIKASLDGKMQHRPTDPIPRPVHEYIHNGVIPAPAHVPLIELAAGIVESGTFDAGATGTWKDHKYMDDGEGAVLSGEQLTLLTEAMDKLDRYNQPFPDDQLESYESSMKTFFKEGGNRISKAGFKEQADFLKVNSRDVEIGMTTIEIFKKRFYEERRKRQGVKRDAAVPLHNLEPIKEVLHKMKLVDENGGDPLAEHNLAAFKELYKGVPDLYGDEVLSDGPYVEMIDANDFSDLESLWYEWPLPDEKRTLPFGIGMLYNQDSRFPYRADPSFNYFMGDPEKGAFGPSSRLDYDDFDFDGAIRESKLILTEESVAPAFVHQVADLIDIANGNTPKGVDPQLFESIQKHFKGHAEALRAGFKLPDVELTNEVDADEEVDDATEVEDASEVEDSVSDSDGEQSQQLAYHVDVSNTELAMSLFANESNLVAHTHDPILVPSAETAQNLLTAIKLLDPALYVEAKELASTRSQYVDESASEGEEVEFDNSPTGEDYATLARALGEAEPKE